jgi:D-methionine transport system substrate-binding protein
MKKIVSITLAVVLALSLVFLTACSGKSSAVKIAVPNDTTNEARALLLLEDLGYIKLKDGAGITATVKDIAENPHNIEFSEVEAAQIPNVLKDVDYAVINSNYAISAGINPVKDSLAIEGSSSAYGNILAAKEGNENSDKIKALKAALESQQVADFISEKYDGAVVSTVTNPGNGYDDSVDYDALSGQTISVAASPTPHAEILAVAKEILAAKNITLDIIEYTDYVQPNNVVDSGEVDANYFQHTPYLDDFNAENGTHVVAVSTIHVEPMGLYGGTQDSLDALNK